MKHASVLSERQKGRHRVARARRAAMLRKFTLQISRRAQRDPLTDLPNRTLLHDRIEHAIALARRHGRQLAVLFVDLDHFKHVNDSWGHTAGDRLLTEVANRLVGCVRGSDTVSRIGGDEFVVLLSEIARQEDAAATAEKMRAALEAPFDVEGHEILVGASVGLSVFPGDGDDAGTLVKNADLAMYRAKDAGRNDVRFYRHDMNLRATERQSIEVCLGGALERNELELAYQPKLDLDTGAITGAEALLRWRRPDRGLTPAAQFVPIAEACGAIVSIGEWVLLEACRRARAWRERRASFERVAVNASAVELRRIGFPEVLSRILREAGLEPRCLEIELSEEFLTQNVESGFAVLHALSAMGVRLAIDDFGSGSASLTSIRRFPIDTLKIDQSLVRDVSSDPDVAITVSAVIAMGQSLDRSVVAEGIETARQAAFLRLHGCREGQGYYFGEPAPAAAFSSLLEMDASRWRVARWIPAAPISVARRRSAARRTR